MAKKADATAKAVRLKPHPFVSSIVRDPGKLPRLRVIRGYVGESGQKNHVRIYLNLELRHYVDVPADGIAHSQDAPELPLGGTYVWIREEAKISHGGSIAAPEDPTTMATGEEGGEPPTTMATGEEDGGLPNPLDAVSNPFGGF